MNKIFNIYKNIISSSYRSKSLLVIGGGVLGVFALILTISVLVQGDTNTTGQADAANTVEPENSTASGNITVANNDNASGGKYLVLGSATISPTQNPTPTPTPIVSAGRCTGLEEPPIMDPAKTVTFINVCPGDAGWPTNSQIQGKDVKIILPKDRVCQGKTTAIGGYDNNPAHNIWIVGGKISYTTGASAGLTFAWWSGTAFIEGIEIDMNNSCNDAINSYRSKGGNARVVIQNSYLRGPGYCEGGTHGDLVHIQGGEPSKNDTTVKELVMQNVRGDAINQGLFVPYRIDTVHGVRKLTLDRLDLHLDSRYKYSGGRISSMVYAYPYGNDTIDLPPPDGQSYKDVYLNWWDPWYPDTINRKDITLPNVTGYDSNNCGVFSADAISKAKITGQWCKGTPPNGSFVSSNLIGTSYDRTAFCK